MTTIVWDTETLAVDSQSTDPASGTTYPFNKLQKWSGGLFTVAGKVSDYSQYRSILEGKDGNVSKNSVCVYTFGDKVYELVPKFGPMEITFKCAWGTGSDLALGALEQGADAVQAVKIAIKRNAFTGGRVRSVKVR